MKFKPGDYALTFGSKFPSNNGRVVRLVCYLGNEKELEAYNVVWDNAKGVRTWGVAPEAGTLLDGDGKSWRELPWAEHRLIPLDGPGDPSVSTGSRQKKPTRIV